MAKEPFKLTVKDLRLIQQVLRSSNPANPNTQASVIALYDRVTEYLNK
jgi:hypothetical protein